jgi:hypothetical protein
MEILKKLQQKPVNDGKRGCVATDSQRRISCAPLNRHRPETCHDPCWPALPFRDKIQAPQNSLERVADGEKDAVIS